MSEIVSFILHFPLYYHQVREKVPNGLIRYQGIEGFTTKNDMVVIVSRDKTGAFRSNPRVPNLAFPTFQPHKSSLARQPNYAEEAIMTS